MSSRQSRPSFPLPVLLRSASSAPTGIPLCAFPPRIIAAFAILSCGPASAHPAHSRGICAMTANRLPAMRWLVLSPALRSTRPATSGNPRPEQDSACRRDLCNIGRTSAPHGHQTYAYPECRSVVVERVSGALDNVAGRHPQRLLPLTSLSYPHGHGSFYG